MQIAEATEYLANLLSEYYKARDSEDMAIPFLAEVARIVEFRELGALDEWDESIFNVFSDRQWKNFRGRDDFSLLDSVWAVGRMNLYGAVNEEATRSAYDKASQSVSNLTNITILEHHRFDLSLW